MTTLSTTLPLARPRLVAHLAMLVFAVLIAGSFTFGAMAVPYLPPFPLNAVRFGLAALVMGAFTFGLARQPFRWPKAPWRFGINGAFMAIYFVTMFIALEITRPVATSAVYTLVPLMTAVTAFFLVRQRSGAAAILSLVVAGLGAIWVIFRGDLQALLAFDVGQGELIYFVGCVAYAFYTPLLRRFSRGESPLTLSFWTLTATAVWITAAGLPDIVAVNWLAVPPIAWWVILYLAVGPTAICFFLVQFASLHLPAAKVIAYGYLVPAFVIVLEAAIGHGLPSLSIVLGALVTVLGLVVLAFAPERERAPDVPTA
jgi:drug/metabolite transporter (DMT)-like permease